MLKEHPQLWSFVNELKIDQSVAHNGVCLTVVAINTQQDVPTYVVTAMKETLLRSNLGLLHEGDKVNVERSMLMNGRLDGHIKDMSIKPRVASKKVMLMEVPILLSNMSGM